MRQLIGRQLKEIGNPTVTFAENGAEGLEQIENAGNGFDLVLCDLEMPEMNGLQFVKTLRVDPRYSKYNLPVIVLTGHTEEKVVKTAAGLGIQGYLMKPVSRAQLEARIRKALL